MFGQSVEETFVNNLRAADRTESSSAPGRLLAVIALAVGAFVFWATTQEIEEYTRGQGQVVPSSKVQIVQSLEGGIVRIIEVHEGSFVEQGDVIMHIDDTKFASELGQLEERQNGLLAERLRLVAESSMADVLRFPDDLIQVAPLVTSAELEVFATRRQQLDREIDVLEDRLKQRQSELAELEEQQLMWKAMIQPLGEEIKLTEQMTKSGAVPKIELLRLTSKMAELQGDLAVGSATRKRLEAAIDQARSEIDVALSGYILSARQRLAQLQVELAIVQESLRAASDRVARTQVRAPARGTVNALNVTTLGAVVAPGQALAEIVPADDGLLIEVNLRPADVAFVKPGSEVSIKITAYDYLIYGSLNGWVERIGVDTISADDGNEFFRVVVRTDKNDLGPADEPLPISPGMVASVDILTGRKTVMDYLLKPIRRARYEALRER